MGFLPLDKGKANEVCEGFAVRGERSNPKSHSDFTEQSPCRFGDKNKCKQYLRLFAFIILGGKDGIRTHVPGIPTTAFRVRLVTTSSIPFLVVATPISPQPHKCACLTLRRAPPLRKKSFATQNLFHDI